MELTLDTELYEFYQLMRWLKTIKVNPDKGPTNQMIWNHCNTLWERGMLTKENDGESAIFSLTEV